MALSDGRSRVFLNVLTLALPSIGLAQASEWKLDASSRFPDPIENIRSTRSAPSKPISIEGQVLLPDGRPAAGAVVVSSAGGLAEVGADGQYLLEVEVPLDAEAVQMSAIANGAGGSLSARRTLSVPGPGGTTGTIDAEVLYLSAGSGCSPDWLPTFGGLPGVDLLIDSFASFDDGSGPALFVGGHFESAGGLPARSIAKWDGSAWHALASGVDGNIFAMVVFDDGSGPALYVGGVFSHSGAQPISSLAKWDGTSFSPLGSELGGSPRPIVRDLLVYDDGSGPALIAGGIFDTAGGQPVGNIAKWDGTTWTPLGSGLAATSSAFVVNALAEYDDGSGRALYVAGAFDSAGGQPALNIAKWDGMAWSALGGGVDMGPSAMAVFDDGTGPALFIGGGFYYVDGMFARYLAKWNGSTWAPVPNGFDGMVLDFAVVDDSGGRSLYIAGAFFDTSAYTLGIVRWDGTTWAPLSNGTGAPVRAIGVHDDGSGPAVFASGAFLNVGQVPVKFVAKWNGSQWSALGTGLTYWVESMAVFDDGNGPALYVGGAFSIVGTVGAHRIAKWNGLQWSSVGGGLNGDSAFPTVFAMAVYDDGSGPALYVGGDLGYQTGVGYRHIVRWNGLQWTTPGGRANGIVRSLIVHDDGSGEQLYAAGQFSSIGGQPLQGLARWNGQSWSSVGSGLFQIRCMAVVDLGAGSELYVGGSFSIAGNPPTRGVARWDGSIWHELGGGLSGGSLYPFVYALEGFDAGGGMALYVGGSFEYADGQPASNLARWDGSSWAGVGGGTNAQVQALEVFDDGTGPALYVGGQFTRVGGMVARSIAKWDGAAWSALGRGTNYDVRALQAADIGFGQTPALFAGGFFSLSPAGDSFVARWACDPSPVASFCSGDGSSGACPCGNGSSAGQGCANSTGAGATLTYSGSASVGAADLVLEGSNLVPGRAGLYFQANHFYAGGQGIVFGDGLQCAIGNIRRLQVRVADAWGRSSMDVDVGPFSGITPGSMRTYQLWYRDPAGPCSAGFNLSNALAVFWRP